MGTTWRNFGSATRTKMRTDSSTLSSLVSSDATCCGVTALRMVFRLNGGLTMTVLEGLTAGLAGVAERIGLEARLVGGLWSRVCFSFDTPRNLSSAWP